MCACNSTNHEDSGEPLMSDSDSTVEYKMWDIELSSDGFLRLETQNLPENNSPKKSSDN